MRLAFGGVMALLACGCQRPSSDPAVLEAIASEATLLKAAHPVRPGQPEAVPPSQWPTTIASLDPVSVTVFARSVDIAIKAQLDGGWGYGVADRREDLGMSPECWRQVADRVFCHGPC